MITEDYVSFEVAKLLKEKGFPQDPNICNTAYTTKGKFSNNAKSFAFFNKLIKPRRYTIAPTHQMAMKWLREVHNIFIEISVDATLKDKGYQWALYYNSTKEIRPYSGWGNSYEEAVEAAIKSGLL